MGYLVYNNIQMVGALAFGSLLTYRALYTDDSHTSTLVNIEDIEVF